MFKVEKKEELVGCSFSSLKDGSFFIAENNTLFFKAIFGSNHNAINMEKLGTGDYSYYNCLYRFYDEDNVFPVNCTIVVEKV